MKMLARVMLCLLFGMLVACGQQRSNQQHEIRMAVAQPVSKMVTALTMAVALLREVEMFMRGFLCLKNPKFNANDKVAQ